MIGATFRRLVSASLAIVFLISVSAHITPASAGAADEYPTGSIIDESTPQSTLAFFIRATNEIRDDMEHYKLLREKTGSWTYPQPTAEERARIDYLVSEVLGTMDLSAVPEWSRETIGVETAFMLREILRLSKIEPNTTLRKIGDDLWVIPGTYIQIGKISSGMRMGDITFTADTVANAQSMYSKIIAKKPKGEFNTYKFYTESPGGIIPPAWTGFVFALPSFWLMSFGTNTIWQWTLFGISLVALAFAPFSIRRIFPDGETRTLGVAILTMIIAKISNYIVIDVGSLTSSGALVGSIIFSIAFYLAASLSAFMLSEIVAQNYARFNHLNPKNIDSSVFRLLCRIVGVLSALSIIAYGLSTAGFPVMGIVAGLGVGGLAFALAAKPTLENLLAGVVIYLDKSVHVGDHIESKDIEGVVEEIGMRSTRLRGPDGTLISITNSELSDKIIRNKTRTIIPAAEGSD
jgi:MscS family membrane protein